MKRIIYTLFLAILTLSMVQCGDSQAEIQAEKARAEAERARAEADSLKQVMEEAALQDEASDLGLPATSVREKGKLNPVDEGQENASFRKFRHDLLEALKRKDVDYIMNITDENIKASFGDDNGKEGFKKMWNLDKAPKNSLFWQELQNVLELGGTFDNKDKTVFMAPYIYATFPEDYDTFEYGAITGQGVRVRNQASRKGRQVATLSYDIVRLLPIKEPKTEIIGNETHNWEKIQFGEETGFVYGKYVRSPIDFRAGFEKKKDGWKMFFFVAGD